MTTELSSEQADKAFAAHLHYARLEVDSALEAVRRAAGLARDNVQRRQLQGVHEALLNVLSSLRWVQP